MVRAGLDVQTHPIRDVPVDAELIALMKARPNFWVIPVITPASLGGSAPRRAGEKPAWLQDPLLRAVSCDAALDRWGNSFEQNKRVPSPTGTAREVTSGSRAIAPGRLSLLGQSELAAQRAPSVFFFFFDGLSEPG